MPTLRESFKEFGLTLLDAEEIEFDENGKEIVLRKIPIDEPEDNGVDGGDGYRPESGY